MADPENIHTRAHSDVSVVLLAQEVLYHRAKEGSARLVRLAEEPMVSLPIVVYDPDQWVPK